MLHWVFSETLEYTGACIYYFPKWNDITFLSENNFALIHIWCKIIIPFLEKCDFHIYKIFQKVYVSYFTNIASVLFYF